MTTIAWDGKTLAGDKQATNGGTPWQTTKVFKIETNGKKYLVGFSGNLADGQRFVKFVKEGFKGKPKYDCLDAISIDEKGSITSYSENHNPDVIEPKFYAIGSGRDFALGVLAYGADAIDAVRIATELDINTGLGIDAVSFS